MDQAGWGSEDELRQLDAGKDPPAPDDPCTSKIKEVLGDYPSGSEKTGPPVNDQVAVHWSSILQRGLGKEKRKELLDNYPVAENCLNLRAPKVNHEIAAFLEDSAKRQDNFFSYVQQQLAASISALVGPIEHHLKEGDNNKELLKNMVDSPNLLTDAHHTLSIHRRFMLSNQLDPAVKKASEELPVDEWLFGVNFAQSIKNTQEIRKVGLGLKRANRGPTTSSYRGPSTSSYRGPTTSSYGGPSTSSHKGRSQGHSNYLNWERQIPKKRQKKEEGGRGRRQEEFRPQYQGRRRK